MSNQPRPAVSTTITISGIPAGVARVLLQHYRIDETHSNAYTVWQRWARRRIRTAQQYDQLQAAGQLQLLTSPEWLDVHEGRGDDFDRSAHLGISLLRLSW